MPSELHLHLCLPHLSRLLKVLGALVAVAVLSGGIAVAAAPSPSPEPKSAPPEPRVNAANVVTQSGYVPLAPCRIVDTRKAGGTIGGGHGRTFFVAGIIGFAPQGGTSGGCNVPAGASTVALSVTTTGSTAPGYLTLYAHGAARPAANQTSFVRGQTITTLVNAPVALTDGRLDVYTATTTHVVLDVAGYYREPIAGYVNSSGTLGAHSGQVLSSAKTLTGSYSIHLDRSYTGCVVDLTAEQSYYNAGGYVSGSTVIVYTRDVTLTNSPYSDSAFFFTVTC